MTATMSQQSTTPIDTSSPSLCIPRVFPNITEQRIKEVLEVEFGLGEVERIDMVSMKNEKGDQFKRVFVHFIKWSTSDRTQVVRDALQNGEMVKIVYDDPWFWKIGKSHAKKPDHGRGKARRPTKAPERKELSIRELRTRIGRKKRDIAYKTRELQTLEGKLSEIIAAQDTTPSVPSAPMMVLSSCTVTDTPTLVSVEGWGGEERGATPEYTPMRTCGTHVDWATGGHTPEFTPTLPTYGPMDGGHTPTTSPPRDLILGAVACAPPLPTRVERECRTPDSGEMAPLPECCQEGICKEVANELHGEERKDTSQGLCGNRC